MLSKAAFVDSQITSASSASDKEGFNCLGQGCCGAAFEEVAAAGTAVCAASFSSAGASATEIIVAEPAEGPSQILVHEFINLALVSSDNLVIYGERI